MKELYKKPLAYIYLLHKGDIMTESEEAGGEGSDPSEPDLDW